MTHDGAPVSVRSLDQRIRNLAGSESFFVRRKTAMALVVVGQLLPEGVIKGGSAMALRYGMASRFTQDLDAARISSLSRFRELFEHSLTQGWQGFTGRLVERKPPRPLGIPSEYVMQPFDVKLSYQGTSWCTVKFELGHDEFGAFDIAHYEMASDLEHMFIELGFSRPEPVPVLRSEQQIAQKLHALSSPGSERARDLVDIQLLVASEDLDLEYLRTSCIWLFRYRAQHSWPPKLIVTERWHSLYRAAAEDLAVLSTAAEAVGWTNQLIHRIDAL